MRWLATTLFFTAGCFVLGAQGGACCGAQPGTTQLAPPAATGKPIQASGTVGQIQIVPGQGMPYFELKHGGATTRVFLGPMPYLIEENFNPKSGQEVTVKGYQLEDRIIAAEITLVAEKRTVKFRDERGWPLWRGGFGRGRGRY